MKWLKNCEKFCNARKKSQRITPLYIFSMSILRTMQAVVYGDAQAFFRGKLRVYSFDAGSVKFVQGIEKPRRRFEYVSRFGENGDSGGFWLRLLCGKPSVARSAVKKEQCHIVVRRTAVRRAVNMRSAGRLSVMRHKRDAGGVVAFQQAGRSRAVIRNCGTARDRA
jgi:hypothetical protein